MPTKPPPLPEIAIITECRTENSTKLKSCEGPFSMSTKYTLKYFSAIAHYSSKEYFCDTRVASQSWILNVIPGECGDGGTAGAAPTFLTAIAETMNAPPGNHIMFPQLQNTVFEVF